MTNACSKNSTFPPQVCFSWLCCSIPIKPFWQTWICFMAPTFSTNSHLLCTHSLSHSLSHSPHSLTRSVTHSLTHTYSHSLTNSLTHFLSHSLTYTFTHSLALSFSCSPSAPCEFSRSLLVVLLATHSERSSLYATLPTSRVLIRSENSRNRMRRRLFWHVKPRCQQHSLAQRYSHQANPQLVESIPANSVFLTNFWRLRNKDKFSLQVRLQRQ